MSLRKKRQIIKHAKEDEKNHWRQNTTLYVIQYIGWNGGYVCGCNRMWDSKSSSIIVIIATKHFSRFQIHLYIEQCKVKCKNPKRNKNAPYALARVYESIFVFFLKLVVCWDSYVRFLIQKANIILMLLESRVYMFRTHVIHIKEMLLWAITPNILELILFLLFTFTSWLDTKN